MTDARYTHGDYILVPVRDERVQRQSIDEAAVGIEFPAELFQLESRVISACKKHIAYLILRQVVDLHLKRLTVSN